MSPWAVFSLMFAKCGFAIFLEYVNSESIGKLDFKAFEPIAQDFSSEHLTEVFDMQRILVEEHY